MLQKIKAIISFQKIRFLISGGTAAVVDIVFLYFFTDICQWWYVISTIVAFIIAFVISFSLQKYWTFDDKNHENIHYQLFWYLLISVINLILNTLLVYILVDLVHIWYIFSQILVAGFIAINNYFVYKHFIFKRSINKE